MCRRCVGVCWSVNDCKKSARQKTTRLAEPSKFSDSMVWKIGESLKSFKRRSAQCTNRLVVVILDTFFLTSRSFKIQVYKYIVCKRYVEGIDLFLYNLL